MSRKFLLLAVSAFLSPVLVVFLEVHAADAPPVKPPTAAPSAPTKTPDATDPFAPAAPNAAPAEKPPAAKPADAGPFGTEPAAKPAAKPAAPPKAAGDDPFGDGQPAAERNAGQARAVAEIEKLGGRVTVDETNPGKPVNSVILAGSNVTDEGLAHVEGLTQLQHLELASTKVTDVGLGHLKGLTQLLSLNLQFTKVSDAGLEHLKGLTNLKSLCLRGTQVTDAGLEHLKGLTELETLALGNRKVTLEHRKRLTELETLALGNTKVTDAGLEHLKGLTNLQWLTLGRSKVTDVGVQGLKKALPNCSIGREATSTGGEATDPFAPATPNAAPKAAPASSSRDASNAFPTARPKPTRKAAGSKESREAAPKAVAKPLVGGERAILKALKEPTSFEFVETPLQDVVDYIQRTHGIPIRLDRKELESMNIGPDTLVTCKLSGISLRSALDLMLDELGIKWTILREVLLITSWTKAESEVFLVTKTYGLSDLLPGDAADYPYRGNDLPRPPRETDTPDPRTRTHAEQQVDALVDLISATISPKSWEANGGQGTISHFDQRLVVWQNREVHERIAALLADLRAKRQATPSIIVEFQWLWLPTGPYQQLVGGGASAAGRAPVAIDAKVLDQIARKAAGFSGRIMCANGQLVHLASGDRRSVITNATPTVEVKPVRTPDRAAAAPKPADATPAGSKARGSAFGGMGGMGGFGGGMGGMMGGGMGSSGGTSGMGGGMGGMGMGGMFAVPVNPSGDGASAPAKPAEVSAAKAPAKTGGDNSSTVPAPTATPPSAPVPPPNAPATSPNTPADAAPDAKPTSPVPAATPAVNVQTAQAPIPVIVGQTAYQPVIDVPNVGVVVEVRPSVAPGANTAVLDLRSSVTRWGEPSPPARLGSASGRSASCPVDRPNMPAAQMAMTARVPLGKPVLLGAVTFAPADGAGLDKATENPVQLCLIATTSIAADAAPKLANKK